MKAPPLRGERKASGFVDDAEENIIHRFMEIVGVNDEYETARNMDKSIEEIVYDWASLSRKLHKSGYTISEEYAPLAPMNGVDVGTKGRMVLLQDDNEVAYTDIEIKVGTMRMTEYGGQI